MNFVTPQEAVHRRNMIVQAQARSQARAHSHKAVIAIPRLGDRSQTVAFTTTNQKK